VWFAILFVPFVLSDLVQYLTLRWRYAADELVITRGWLVRHARHVPYARVHNLDLRQNVLHRLLGVAEVRIETAGGVEPEVVLRVIGLRQYEELRARVFAGGRARAAPAESSTSEPLVRLGLRDVALLALDPGRGLALLAAAWWLAAELELLERLQLERRISAWAESGAPLASGTLALLWAGLGIAVLYGLSFAGSALAHMGFTLEAEGDVFRVRKGLLTREVLSIPLRRIQVVLVREPPLLRLLGRARVTVVTAGGGKPGERGAEGGTQIAPILPRAALPGLLARIRPGLELGAAPWQPLAPRAPRRFAARELVKLAPLAALIAILAWPWGLGVSALILALGALYARATACRAAYARTPLGILWRQGLLGREVVATFDDKVQTVTVSESPFDRRHRHATLSVDTAGGFLRSVRGVRVPCLARATAEALAEDLLAGAAATRYRV
jgi:putative membrane protein